MLTKALVQVLRVPQHLIVPIIFVLCAVGSFAIAGRLFDVYVMLAFGLIGFFLRALRLPDGAAGAGHRAGRPAGEEPAPRAACCPTAT